MEGVSASMYRKMKGYWKRRGYERLNVGSTKRKMNKVELGNRRRRRFWRIKIKPKLKIMKIASPKKFFVWLRDAYVNMMLRLANSSAVSAGYGYGGAIGSGFGGFGQGPIKEYDEKMIIEIYKKLVMAHSQGNLVVPPDAPRLGSNSVPRLAAIVE